QAYHTVTAKYFADCSGDSILIPLTGAEYRLGREGRCEFEESIAPEKADRKTMGLSCLMTAQETSRPVKYIPPVWANKYTREDLAPYRIPNMDAPEENYWYMELGGEDDSIDDTEILRDKLLKVAYGIWDYIKNSGDYNADNWSLSFVGFLPGKRESRRYVGDHILTQNEVAAEGKFRDTVAFGGWPMDDHHPAGIATKESPNIFHPAPEQYGIPYRCLYSRNIANLFCAGRNISATHAAMSSTRVMATCALLGQAVGTAAAIALQDHLSPRGVYEHRLFQLQQTLMEDDCYLPGNRLEASPLMKKAAISSGGLFTEKLTNGHARPLGEEENAWIGKCGDPIEISFEDPEYVREVRLTLDSDLNRETIGADGYMHRKCTLCNVALDTPFVHLPHTLVKDLRVDISEDGEIWTQVTRLTDIKRRVVYLSVDKTAKALRIVPESSYGRDLIRIFTLDVR
ncbi:MAG: FAD-dependent oxidoreductase, partial [Clostridia bacterium]|nr:FAD-dependent oxidoreductase [Clostridia bacterium]